MKNEPHVIGDRVPNEHDLIADLKLVSQSAKSKEFAPATQHDSPSPMRLPHLHALLGFLGRTWRQRRNRLALIDLNDEQLKDIGLTRCQAYGGGYSRYRRGGTNDADTEA
jgi:uncharacterized protein YjiS (DUF1127 family)